MEHILTITIRNPAKVEVDLGFSHHALLKFHVPMEEEKRTNNMMSKRAVSDFLGRNGGFQRIMFVLLQFFLDFLRNS